MINTESNGNGDLSGGTVSPVHDKKLDGTPKKTALRDVQNENLGSVNKNQESLSPAAGRSIGDTIKVCGTKRLTPERPSSTQGFLSSAYNDTNENVVNARRRFELELGRGRLHNNVEKNQNHKEMNSMVFQLQRDVLQLQHEVNRRLTQVKDNIIPQVPVATSSNPTAAIFSSNDAPVSHAFSKLYHGTPVAKVSPELPHIVDSRSAKEQLRAERFIQLQSYLKQCDEANKRECNQTLMQLSAVELNKYAVVLERRSIQLTIEEVVPFGKPWHYDLLWVLASRNLEQFWEEITHNNLWGFTIDTWGNELQRMRALKILAKPSPVNNLLESTPLRQ